MMVAPGCDPMEAREALYSMDPATLTDGEWLRAMFAAKDAGIPYSDVDSWNMRDPARYDERSNRKRWDSASNPADSDVAAKTLYRMAYDRGWKGPTAALTPPPPPPLTYPPIMATTPTATTQKTTGATYPRVRGIEGAAFSQVADMTPAGQMATQLRALFRNGESACIVEGLGMPGRTVLVADFLDWLGNDDDGEGVSGGPEGTWLVCNPVDGKGRRDADVTAWRHALVECDVLPVADQLAAYARLNLPCATITLSGGKSAHALVRVDAADAAEYKARVSWLYGFLRANGVDVDTANANPARLTRMAGALRGERLQELVSVNVGPASWAEWRAWVNAQAEPDTAGHEADETLPTAREAIPATTLHGLTPTHVNDRELSSLFAKTALGQSVRYVPELGTFAVYDGTVWRHVGGAQMVEGHLKAFVMELERWASGIEDDAARKAMLKALTRYDSQVPRAHLRDDLKSELLEPWSSFDADPRLLNVLNATLEFRDGDVVVREHRPADLITHVAPVTYDPDATCPEFFRTLAESLEGDADLMAYTQKLFGLAVAGDTSFDRFHLVGLGHRSGKDTVFGALAGLLGMEDDATGYALVVDPATFATKSFANPSGPSSDRARMEHRRLILTTEVDESFELDAEFMKRVTGGTPIAARRMRQDERQFRIVGQVVLLANRLPSTGDAELFDADRARCIPFDHEVPPERIDRRLRDRLRTDPRELSGLLNWCLDGWRKACAEGMGTPDAVRDMTERWAATTDEVAAFVRGHLVPREGASVTAQAVHDAYRRHGGTMGRNAFYARMGRYVPMREFGKVNGRMARNVIEGRALKAEEGGAG